MGFWLRKAAQGAGSQALLRSMRTARSIRSRSRRRARGTGQGSQQSSPQQGPCATAATPRSASHSPPTSSSCSAVPWAAPSLPTHQATQSTVSGGLPRGVWPRLGCSTTSEWRRTAQVASRIGNTTRRTTTITTLPSSRLWATSRSSSSSQAWASLHATTASGSRTATPTARQTGHAPASAWPSCSSTWRARASSARPPPGTGASTTCSSVTKTASWSGCSFLATAFGTARRPLRALYPRSCPRGGP
mmetsp:Transcript_17015/g.41531  ORF Transcript_17015/g.41531 Transcript_17015/m.41531 type:complete len:247 (-) Transcript_17015:1048-1788(-)